MSKMFMVLLLHSWAVLLCVTQLVISGVDLFFGMLRYVFLFVTD